MKYLIKYQLLILFFICPFFITGQDNCGIIVENEVCTNDTTQSYTYYLPSYYSTDRFWPAVFVFEPAARGNLGVSVFQQTAEKYGLLIFCSNNSRNGPVKLMIEAGNAVYTDVHEKFSIDKNQQIISGFSGGSRVALYLAYNSTEFDAVIGCGAGHPALGEIEKPFEFYYYGIVGNGDFNYVEMLKFQDDLESLKVSQQLSLFEGTHQWPTPVEIEQAVLCIMLHRVKVNKLPLDEFVVDRYNYLMDSLQLALKDGELYFERYRKLKQWKSGLAGFRGGKKVDSIYLEVLNLPETKQAISRHDDLLSQEDELTQSIQKAMRSISYPYLNQSEDLEWWHKKINQLKEIIEGDNVSKSEMATRILTATSVNAYYGAERMIEFKQYEKAEYYIKIWLMGTPYPSRAHYMMAQIKIMLGKNKEAVIELDKAFHAGMSDYSRILNDTVFDKLKGNKRFENLIKEMDTLN